jgi:NADH dehydrogenase FAD-containing subunit
VKSGNEEEAEEHATASTSTSDTLAQRKEAFRSWRKKIVEAARVVILGGGSVGVELAGEIAGHFRGKKKVILWSKSSRILSSSQMTWKASQYCHRWLEKRNVEIRLNQQGVGEPRPGDLLFRCFGARPNLRSFELPVGMRVCEKEGVEVSDTMQSVSHTCIFAVGDVASSAFEKTAFSADVQACVAARNIIRLAKRSSSQEVKEEEESGLDTFPGSMCHGSSHLPLVVVISLFKHSGSAQINQFVINGFLAAWMKRVVEHFQLQIANSQGKGKERVWGFFERCTLFLTSYCNVFGKAP